MSKKTKVVAPAYDLSALVTDVYGELSGQVFSSWNLPKPLSVRHNSILDPSTDALEDLSSAGICVERMPWYEDGWLLSAPETDSSALIEKLESTKSWQHNWLYRQNLASMIPPLLLDLHDGSQVLDITAAPGSKTSEIAALLHNTGLILANDVSQPRLFRLKTNLGNLGVTNTTIQHGLAEKVWQQFPEVFDSALVDAPCSMMGRINLLDPKTKRAWSVKESKSLAKRQQWMLQSAISTVKSGGTVVYSTCTLSPFENELVVDWTLKHARRPISLVAPSLIDMPESLKTGERIMIPGLTKWHDVSLDPDLQKTWRIVPNSQMEGFFVAKFKVS